VKALNKNCPLGRDDKLERAGTYGVVAKNEADWEGGKKRNPGYRARGKQGEEARVR